MSSYIRTWNCEKCGVREESIDWPKYELCDDCDDKTMLRCVVCGGPTNITPTKLVKSGHGDVAHRSCIYIDENS